MIKIAIVEDEAMYAKQLSLNHICLFDYLFISS